MFWGVKSKVSLIDEARELLKRALDDSNADFRDQQWEAIEQLVEKRSRLLVVQRTGWVRQTQ